MEIKKITLAETLESSDVKVTVEPSNKGVLGCASHIVINHIIAL